MEINTKSKFIKDVIHGEIVFEHPWAAEIVKTIEFTRLFKIKQLGVSYRLFPNAMHTRFAHSLGTYYIANQIIRQLPNQFFKKDANELSAAALLHDLGHGPHSHAFEEYTAQDHETYSKALISTPGTGIYKILVKYGINPKNVCAILDHNHKNDFLNDLISSQIDADRMDYLARDAHFTGACYGNIDTSIILKWLMVKQNKLCFSSKAVSSIENFLIARFHMYKQVYEQPKTIAMQQLIKKMLNRFKYIWNKKRKMVVDKFNLASFFEAWLSDRPYSLDEYIKIDDVKFEMFIEQMQYEKDPYIKEAYHVYTSYANQDYKIISPSKENIAQYKKLLSKKTKNYDLYMHRCKISSKCIYHKDKQPIWIYDEQTNKVIGLEKASQIIKKLNHTSKWADVLVANNNI